MKNFKVKLDTNGSRPDIIKNIINNKLIDYIAMDIKSSISKYSNYSDDNNIEDKIIESIKVIKNSEINYEFRTTVVPGLHNENDIEEITKIVAGSKNFTIQNFRGERTYDKDFENKLPFTEKELETFKDILEDKVNNIKIKS